MIRINCPSCQSSLRGDDTLAGRSVTCPKCQRLIAVPAPAPSSHVADDVSAPEPRKQIGRRQPAPHEPEPDDDLIAIRHGVTRRRRRRKRGADYTFVYCTIGLVLLCLALIGLGTVKPTFSSVGILLAWVVSVVGQLWIVVIAFGEDTLQGALCLVIPFYSVYYVITRFDDCRRPLTLAAAGLVLIALGTFSGAQLPWEMKRGSPGARQLG